MKINFKGKKVKFISVAVVLSIIICTTLIFSLQISAAIADKEDKFLGNVMGNYVPDNYGEYWNQVTPENATKWGSVESTRDSMNWSNSDKIFNYATKNNIPFKFHTLVWGSQEPNWVSSLSTKEQKEEVIEWIELAGEKYGNCEMIDVVNEPLHAKPSYKDSIGGDGATGWDWVIWAFEYARENFNGKLILNDYGIVNDSNACSNYLKIINLLLERDLIDGIGVQAHTFNVENYDASTIKRNLDSLAKTGLPIYVSELDLSGDDSTQLRHYKEKFPVFWEHPGVYGVTLWGYIQGETWKDTAYLVSSSSTSAAERPALEWIKDYLGSSSETETPIVTETNTPANTPISTETQVNGDFDIDYSITSDWGSGATISITFTNNTSVDKNGWDIRWNFTGNQEINNMWNAEFVQKDKSVTVSNVSWNSKILSGQSISFGFNIVYSVENSIPTDFIIE